MKTSARPPERPASLEAQISNLENRLLRRRRAIGSGLQDLAGSIRNRLVSPASLFAAGLFGFLLHREQSLRSGTMLSMLQAGIGGVRLLSALAAMMGANTGRSAATGRSTAAAPPESPPAADARPD